MVVHCENWGAGVVWCGGEAACGGLGQGAVSGRRCGRVELVLRVGVSVR